MHQILNKIPRNYQMIIYKLAADFLWLCLIFLFFMLIGESLLPGFISSGMKFTIAIIVIILDMAFIEKLADYLQINKEEKRNKKALFAGAVIFAIFIFNSLFKLFQFNIFLALFSFFLVLLASYFIYKLLFEN
jgi:hypothetical protein